MPCRIDSCISMTNLEDILGRLDLTQYHEVLVQEGFDTWETLMDITETDLETLGVKLGHRRKLQRAILNASSKDRLPLSAISQWDSNEDTLRDGDDDKKSKTSQQQQQQQPLQLRQQETSSSNTSNEQPRSKRKYRRHPKPDEFAPERPPSAYVIFSNGMRDKLKGQDLTFTEIAKLVGERWQELEGHEKEPYETEAQSLKDRYYAELRDYKKTAQYHAYQEYLAEFKAKHAEPKQENKKSKLNPPNTAQPLSPSVNASNSEALSTILNDSPSESTQNSPANSSAGSETYRRFPLAKLLSDDDSRPVPPSINNVTAQHTHFGPPLRPLQSATTPNPMPFSDKRSLLNWPIHTMLPPIDPKPLNRSTSRSSSPTSTFKAYQLPEPHTATRFSSRNYPHQQQKPSPPSKKPTLSTLLLATEHVERDSKRCGSGSNFGSDPNSGIK